MQSTQNYGLPYWEASDLIAMADFNRLTSLLDTALSVINNKAETLSSHRTDTNNPHQVTAAQVGAPALLSTGVISTSNLPTIPMNKGGTGATTISDARTNLSVYSKEEITRHFHTCYLGCYRR